MLNEKCEKQRFSREDFLEEALANNRIAIVGAVYELTTGRVRQITRA